MISGVRDGFVAEQEKLCSGFATGLRIESKIILSLSVPAGYHKPENTPMVEKCNCPVNPEGQPFALCGEPAEKFYVVTPTDNRYGSGPYLHPRCQYHWENTALPTSPLSVEVTEEEFAVWKVMMA